MSIEIESIIHANLALLDYREKLYSLYVESYGEEYSSIIRDRMKNTLYLFDSNPIDTMNFLINNSITDSKVFSFYEREYFDYVYWKNKIDKKYQKRYYQLLSRYFHYRTSDWESLLSLEYSSYNFENIAILHQLDSSEEAKNSILKRQRKYLEDCKALGITPITDSVSIHMIEENKRAFDQKKNIELLQRTKWGKRMIERIRKYYKLSIPEIHSILNCNSVAATNHIYHDNISLSILYFPIIKNIPNGCLDRIFFHENRHVIESSVNHCGLHYYSFKNLSLMNELHTEDNAIHDSLRCYNDPLWSRDSLTNGCTNVYERLLGCTDDFFEENRDFFNQCAICGDYHLLEEKFTGDGLLDYEHFLEGVRNYYSKNRTISDEYYLQNKELIKKMKL